VRREGREEKLGRRRAVYKELKWEPSAWEL
jgi:hypothetical protein